MTTPHLGSSSPSRLTFFRTPRGIAATAAIAAFIFVVLQGPALSFTYDAMVYWSSTTSLLSGGDFFAVGGLILRGAWSTLVYLPAGLVATAVPSLAGPAVLVQNALLVAFLGAYLIPMSARLFGELRPVQVWISAATTAVVFGGMAPYPLMDLWAASLVFGAISLVALRPQWWSFALGGLMLSIAVNIRPAYVVPALLIFLLWAVSGRLRVLWAVVGGLLALIPQIALNYVALNSLLPWPVKLAAITSIQSKYASYIVRYDTVTYVGNELPRLFYCSPGMAVEFENSGPPANAIELIGAFFQTLPGSLQFVAQKVTSSLFWTTATPYSGPPTNEISALTLIVVLVSVIGFVALLRAALALRKREAGVPFIFGLALLALWLGTVGTLVFSTPEARFAIPLILVGLVGTVIGVGQVGAIPPSRTLTVWALLIGAAVVAVLVIGQAGLTHPAPIGDATVKICSDPESFRE